MYPPTNEKHDPPQSRFPPGSIDVYPDRFETALWSACNRLPTWKDKPESQASSRGGLKRSSPVAAASPSSAVDDSTTVATVAGGTETGDGVTGEGGTKTSNAGQPVLVSGSPLAKGAKGSMPVTKEEEELRDALSRSRQAEVTVNGHTSINRPMYCASLFIL